jgi:hypothetical protein
MLKKAHALSFISVMKVLDATAAGDGSHQPSQTPILKWHLKHVHIAESSSPARLWMTYTSLSTAHSHHQRSIATYFGLHVAGINNTMADIASCIFSRNSATATMFNISDADFLQSFLVTSFPPENNSWRIFRLSDKLCLRIFSEL